MAKLEWEEVEHNNRDWVYRAKVPGGWLVYFYGTTSSSGGYGGLTFVPDPKHEWN